MAMISDFTSKTTPRYTLGWTTPNNRTGPFCENACSQREYHQEVYRLWSEVTSYRGKRQYVQVGNKRRKKFNPFYRFRHFSDTKDAYKCCSNDGIRCYYCSDFVASLNLREGTRYLTDDPAYSNGKEYRGDPCYAATPHALGIIADNVRDTFERDLFVKANAPVFEGAVFLAELGETITSVKSLLTGAIKGLTKVKAFKAQLKHSALNFEELWLWYRYFLLPAMMDAEDLMAAFQDRLPIDRVQDGIKKPDWGSWENGTITMVDVFPWEYDIEFEYRTRTSAGGAIDLHSRHDPHEWGVSAMDLVRAGWEVVPFSFVLDWFIGVGDWLASWRDVDLVIAQSYSTVVVEGEYKVKRLTPESVWHSIGDDYHAYTYLMERKIDIEPPMTPRFQTEKLSLFRKLDAAALILGILKGFLRKNRRALTSKRYTE